MNNQEIITLLIEIRDELIKLNDRSEKMMNSVPKNMPQVDELTKLATGLLKGVGGMGGAR